MPRKTEKLGDKGLKKEKPGSEDLDTGGLNAIETRQVGLPSSEATVAKTVGKEQVEVSPLQPGEVTAEKILAISNREQTVIAESKDLPLEQKATMAREAVKQSQEQGSDLQELAALFDKNLNYLLKINSPLANPEIPQQGMHFLLAKSESGTIKSALLKAGYNLIEIGNLGFQASKNLNNLVFVYAQEKNKKERNN